MTLCDMREVTFRYIHRQLLPVSPQLYSMQISSIFLLTFSVLCCFGSLLPSVQSFDSSFSGKNTLTYYLRI